MKNYGTIKKLLAWILAAVAAAGMTAGAMAGEIPTAITGVAAHFGSGGYSLGGEAGAGSKDVSDLASLTLRPGDEVFLPITYKDFTWKDDKFWPITMKTLDDLGISMEYDFIRGEDAVKDVGFATRKSQTGILFRMEEELAAVEPVEFRAEIRVWAEGADAQYGAFTFGGSVSNRNLSIYNTTRSLELGSGRMATCYADGLTDFPFELDGGVTLKGNVNYGDKVYAHAVREDREEDAALRRKHSSIQDIYYLNTVNLDGTVYFESGSQTLYVYDQDLNYLGAADAGVGVEEKYIVTTAML